MKLNPKIFKAYDIRGEWGREWDSESAYKIGLALASLLKPKKVALGRDMRTSSKEIFSQLSRAFLEQGIDIYDLGLCGTELTYFSTSFVPEIDLAVMITASHNPGKDNGLKVTLRNSLSLGLDSGLDQIRDLASDISLTPKLKPGTLTKTDLWPQYREHVFKLAGFSPQDLSAKKIVIDAGNGIGGFMFDQVLYGLPGKITKMFWQPDGNFPNHPADPFIEKNVEALKRKVVEEKADLGLAYDGDSDRLFVVDEKGRYIPGYYLAALMSDLMLQGAANPKEETIAYDPRYYWATKDALAKHSATPVPSKVGHTLIKAKMREYNSLFSAECSGHVFYRKNNFAESSMLTTLLVVKLLSQGPFSKLVDPFFEKYPVSGEINFVVENPQEIVKKLERNYQPGEISRLDGIGIDFPEWRFNVRSSNTQPLLRLNVEAKRKLLLIQKVKELKEIIGGTLVEH